jgi:hypothetical protein
VTVWVVVVLAIFLLPALPLYLWTKGRLSMRWGLGLAGAALFLYVLVAVAGGADSEEPSSAPSPSPVATAVPTPSASPTPAFAPTYGDVAADVNAYLVSMQYSGTFSDTSRTVDDAIGKVCKAADGIMPSEASRKGFIESVAGSFGDYAAGAFDATVASCRAHRFADEARVFREQDFLYGDLMTALHKAGFDEYILKAVDPDQDVIDTCDDISGKKAGGGTEQEKRRDWVNTFVASWSWSETKANRFVDTLFAKCRSLDYSEPYVPPMTASQEQAVGKAEDYINYTAFSRSGLIKQLEYEDFSRADATFAVDHITVDWNKQAVKKAKDYLDYSHFSHSGLVQQLQYEGFTRDQAEHGAKGAGL